MFVFENGHPSLMESMERGHHPLEKYAIIGALLFHLLKFRSENPAQNLPNQR